MSVSKKQRLQGTDGIRRETRKSNIAECKGLTPQKVFLEKGWINEQFMELYVYSHIKNIPKKRGVKDIVLGWDPRDPSGLFVDSVIKGIRKAGANALVLGIVPTPLVPLFMLYKKADSGIMITASHNPNDQNGIKLFSSFHGMKPLPTDDLRLTNYVIRQTFSSINNSPLKGKIKECRNRALDLFKEFTLSPENSWIDDSVSFKNVVLVVDPANGSLTGIAKNIFKKVGFEKILEVNGKLNGDVNLFSGVADLEGRDRITDDQIQGSTGFFSRHKAIKKTFKIGRKNRISISKGKMRVVGAIFDADGDRFYMLEYDPFKDLLWVLSGDETAILQANYLSTRFPKEYKNSLYINTVESDLNAAIAAKKMGLKPQITAVGDKWILLKIFLKRLEKQYKDSDFSKPPRCIFNEEIKRLKKTGVTSISSLQKLEIILGRKKASHKRYIKPILAVGSEETGHNITESKFTRSNGERVPIYSGNGLKSALNTLVATQHLTGPTKKYYAKVSRPFNPGFKDTLYVYYIHQDLFFKGSVIWKKLKQIVLDAAKKKKYSSVIRNFSEDPDMLYISISAGKAGIFVRNSGTENKISVNLRGSKADAPRLRQIGFEVIKILFANLKNRDHHFYKLELYVLSQIASQPLKEKDLKIEKQSKARLLSEMLKQRIIEANTLGVGLTPLGKWYLKN